jgi:hypothetical protein
MEKKFLGIRIATYWKIAIACEIALMVYVPIWGFYYFKHFFPYVVMILGSTYLFYWTAKTSKIFLPKKRYWGVSW